MVVIMFFYLLVLDFASTKVDSNITQPTVKNITKECTCGMIQHRIKRALYSNAKNRTFSSVVAGRDMHESQHPFLALITKHKELHCGGSVISSRYVLSAAHCFIEGPRDTKEIYGVILGIHNRLIPEPHAVFYSIETVKVHALFKTLERNKLVNDIALVKVKKEILYNSFIQPICLPSADFTFETQGYVQGWGKTRDDGIPTAEPLQAGLTVITGQACAQYPVKPFLVDLTTIVCAIDAYSDSCMGDSGGPLITSSGDVNVLTGIVSFGVGCAKPGYPGIYTKVDAFLDWIYNNTQDTIHCSSNIHFNKTNKEETQFS